MVNDDVDFLLTMRLLDCQVFQTGGRESPVADSGVLVELCVLEGYGGDATEGQGREGEESGVLHFDMKCITVGAESSLKSSDWSIVKNCNRAE